VGSGGRYDGLLEKFGAPLPAAGFAVDIDNLDWALRQRQQQAAPARVLVAMDGAADVLPALRALGVCCAPFSGTDAMHYASAWAWSHVLSAATGGVRLLCVLDGSAVEPITGDASAVAAAVAAHVGADG
jgi:ATP phosphoribosyltransferase regulatory subunit